MFFSLHDSAQEVKEKISLKGNWAITYPARQTGKHDTITFTLQNTGVNYGIEFFENGDYKKMVGWEYCGTYMHKHPDAQNEPLYELGKWIFEEGNDQTIFKMVRNVQYFEKYKLISKTPTLMIVLSLK